MTAKPLNRDAKTTIEVLFEITDAVNRKFDLKELFDTIHKSLGRIINVDNFCIAIYNEKKDSISFAYWINEMDPLPEDLSNFSSTASLTGEVIKAGKPLLLYKQDIIEFSRKKKTPPVGHPSEIWLGAPLVTRGRVTGAIAVQSFTSRTMYQASDLDLLNSVSHHIALAIDRKHSENAIKNKQIILEKVLAVLEMAGAVCHELNQPLQAIMGYSELIMMDQEPESFLARDLGIIRNQTKRIGAITKRLSEITNYKTMDYPDQTKIVDIWGSSGTLD